MFNFFKTQKTDESLEEQASDLQVFPEELSKVCLDGLDCDQISNHVGEFGTNPLNPIPVNGPLGEIKYLNRLRCESGVGFIYHRLRSIEVIDIDGPVDIFEVVAIDGSEWGILYFHMYHPRRSRKNPSGYSFDKYHELHSRLPMGFGTTQVLDQNFPFGISDIIRSEGISTGTESIRNGLAKHCDIFLKNKDLFSRPDEHHKLVLDILKPSPVTLKWS